MFMRVMLDSKVNDGTTFVFETSFVHWGNYIDDGLMNDLDNIPDIPNCYEGYLCFDTLDNDSDSIYVVNMTMHDAEKAITYLFNDGKLDLTGKGYLTL